MRTIMVTREESFKFTPQYPIERLGKPDEVLFFDIETTGLSADKNQVYMIGVLRESGDEWKLTQWLSDSPEAEGDLLDAFFTCLSNFKVIVSFNGETFDMPFLLRRNKAWERAYDFSGVESVDIYKVARPYKNLLGLENCKQKTIECFLGIDRDDIYSGGELINVYMQYLYTKDDSFADLLLLHNADDLRGMPKILPILSYSDIFSAPLHFVSMERPDDETGENSFVTLHCRSDVSVPTAVSIREEPIFCLMDGNEVTITARLTSGTMKHYFPDPSEYDYLIYEDMAVHKSVGQYVSRQARRQATASTCYVKQEGSFFPQLDEIWEPVMKTDRNDKMCYVNMDDIDLEDPDKWEAFSRRMLEWLSNGKHSAR